MNVLVCGELPALISEAIKEKFKLYSSFNSKTKKWTLRTSKGGKQKVTAAQQKRAKIKRKNKAK